MPNHVYMNMHINGTDQEVANFFEKHFNDDNQFDFETFKPMPEALRGTTAPVRPPRVNDKEVEPNSTLYKAWEKETANLREEHGYDNWYDWHIANWGTKWNSYDNEIHDDNSFHFETAWSMPEPIFEMMAEMYPTMSFEIEVVEEGGYYAGRVFIAEGKVREDLTSDGDEWRAYATEFMGWTFDEQEADERDDAITMLDSTIANHKGNAAIVELVLFAKENIDDFVKFSKP